MRMKEIHRSCHFLTVLTDKRNLRKVAKISCHKIGLKMETTVNKPKSTCMPVLLMVTEHVAT